MPTLMARHCSPELVARVKREAHLMGLSTEAAIPALLAYAVDQREARRAGAAAANQGRSARERRASATRAVETRWYPLRAALLRLAETQPSDLTPAARWMIDGLADAEPRLLRPEDLARIDAYAGEAQDLHELLAAVLPLRRSVWYETSVTAQRGTETSHGTLAVGVDAGVELGFAALATTQGRLIGPMGPALVTATGMDRPTGTTDATWRELRSAAGIVLRALLLDL